MTPAPSVCVIGGGILGLAAARDAALRGFACTLIERGELGAETTTHCVGHLHSGARYATSAAEVAARCHRASREVLEVAPFAVSGQRGLFTVLDSHPAGTADRFAAACRQSGIPIRWLERTEALRLEPRLGPQVAGAFETPDRVVNPYALVEAHFESLRALGVDVLDHCTFLGAARRRSGTWVVQVRDRQGRARQLQAEGLVNATGPWAPDVARACGVELEAVRIQGGTVVLGARLCSRIVSVCSGRAAGDVVIPSGGRTLVGSTWRVVPGSRAEPMQPGEVDGIVATASSFLPAVRRSRVLHVYAGVRLQVRDDGADDRPYGLVPDVHVVEHRLGGEGLGIVTGILGKLTLFNHGARAIVDALLAQQDRRVPSRAHEPLPVPPTFTGRELAHAREAAVA